MASGRSSVWLGAYQLMQPRAWKPAAGEQIRLSGQQSEHLALQGWPPLQWASARPPARSWACRCPELPCRQICLQQQHFFEQARFDC